MRIMFRCRLKPEEVERNLELLKDVYEELTAKQPAGLSYETFQLDDEVTFVAIAELDNPAMLQGMEAFQRYRSTLDERCAEPTVMTVLHEVGSYTG